MQISTLIYMIILTTALICATYNWMYKKEIFRMEKHVGVTIPLSLVQLLTAIITGSLVIAVISFFLLLISFLI